jgi:norsolorinic acid ketoreductase
LCKSTVLLAAIPLTVIASLSAHGITHIDVVISAAGIAVLGTVEDIAMYVFEECLMVNALSVMLL